MSTFFVTGATGFLGGRAVEMLLELEHGRSNKVVAIGRNKIAGARLAKLGATFVQGDILDRALLENAIPEGAIVIHCAALSSPWGTRDEFYKANVLGTRNVAEVALQKNTSRFIHISTPSIYIEKCDKTSVREGDRLPSTMINLYAETKLEAEAVIDLLTAKGLPAISLRPQGIFGPGDQAIMPRIIRIAKKGFIPVIGKGDARIDLTYVDNVVDAIFKAVEAPATLIGQKYNISNGEPVRQTEALISIVEKLGLKVRKKHIPFSLAWNLAAFSESIYRNLHLKGEPTLTRYSVCALAFSRTLDIEKAKKELGYVPKISFDEGVKRYIAWYKQ